MDFRHANALIALIAAAASWGCSSDGGLSLNISFARQAATGACTPHEGSEAGREPPCGMDRFRICAASSQIGAAICGDHQASEGNSGVTLKVPEGTYSLSFQGFDSASGNAVTWCGLNPLVAVRAGLGTDVSIFISRCSDTAYTRTPMSVPRAFHTATRLRDGKVLLAGGISYLTGGQSCGKDCTVVQALQTTEIYDPGKGTFTPLESGLARPRAFHTATLLPDGRVLISGGAEKAQVRKYPAKNSPLFLPHEFGSAGASTEVFDPVTQTFSPAAKLLGPRFMHSALFTRGSRILLIGGYYINGTNAQSGTIEVMDSLDSTGTAVNLQRARAASTATDYSPAEAGFSTVLIWGGNEESDSKAGTYAETYLETPPPGTTHFPQSLSESPDGLPVSLHAACATVGGRILVSGGVVPGDFTDGMGNLLPAWEPLRDTRLVEVKTDPVVQAPQSEPYMMRYPRALHTTTPLPDGRVLVVGGLTSRTPSCSTPMCFTSTETLEVFLPDSEIFDTIHPPEITNAERPFISMGVKRAGHSATLLLDGTVLLSGGLKDGAEASATAEVFNPHPNKLMEY